MNLVNVAIEKLGAKIKTSSSFLDDLHQPANILKPNDNSLWTTTQGLPQFIIVSLQDLNVNFRSINEVKFLLWHDYDTNPKTIELWVAQTTTQNFTFWSQFFLNQKKGIQVFQIQSLPSRFIYLKILITQTYGAFETYLNQVFLMAEQVTPKRKTVVKKDIGVKKRKQLDLKDLQSGLNELIEMDRRISRTKSKSNVNDYSSSSSSQLLNFGNSKSIGFGPIQNFNSSSKKSYPLLSGDKKYYVGNQLQKYLKQHKRLPQTHYDEKVMTLKENEQQLYVGQEQQQINSKQDRMINESQSQSLQQSQERSYHAAFLALSENVIKLQDNMEAIQRRVQVLDMKVLHSHEKIQKQLLEKLQIKVEQIVDRKIKRIYSVKNVFKDIEGNLSQKNKERMKTKKTLQDEDKNQQLRGDFGNREQRFEYKKNLTKQFFAMKSQQQQQREFKQRDKTKSKAADRSRGVTVREDTRTERRLPDRQHLAGLLQKLSAKLKERQAKLAKMQHRGQYRQRDTTNKRYNKGTVPDQNLLQ